MSPTTHEHRTTEFREAYKCAITYTCGFVPGGVVARRLLLVFEPKGVYVWWSRLPCWCRTGMRYDPWLSPTILRIHGFLVLSRETPITMIVILIFWPIPLAKLHFSTLPDWGFSCVTVSAFNLILLSVVDWERNSWITFHLIWFHCDKADGIAVPRHHAVCW